MTIAIDLPAYDEFRAWFASGKPRNIDGKPIPVTQVKRSQSAQQTPAAQQAARAEYRVKYQKRDRKPKRIEHIDQRRSMAQASKEGIACRRFIEQCKREGQPRPNSTVLGQQFNICRNTAAGLVTRVYGNAINRSGCNAAREWLKGQPFGPEVKALAKRFDIGIGTVGRILMERFGRMEVAR